MIHHQIIVGIAIAVAVTGCQRQKLDIKTSLRNQAGFESSQKSSESSSAAMSSSSTSNQQLTAEENSSIEGSSVTVRPGTLAIDSTLTIQEGAGIAGQAIFDELGIAADGIEATAPAVIVSTNAPADPAGSLLISIPAPEEASLNLTNDYSKLVVIYLIEVKKLGIILSGVLPRSMLTVANGMVNFETPHYGSFQAVILKDPVAEKKEVKSAQAIKTKFGDVVASTGVPSVINEPSLPGVPVAEKPLPDTKSPDGSAKEVPVEAKPEPAPVPTVVAVKINGGVSKTTSMALSLDIDVTGNPKSIKVSETGDCKSGTWEPFVTPVSFQVSSGDGTKTVSVKLQNSEGAESNCMSASVSLLTHPGNIPVSPWLKGVSYDRSVNLSWGSVAVQEFLLLRSPTGSAGQPEDLKDYVVGDMIGDGLVIYRGSDPSFADELVSNGVKYRYIVHSVVSGPFYSPSGPVTTAVPFAGFVELSAGDSHTCAIDAAGVLYCWGLNDDGQLGVNDMDPRTLPTKVDVSKLAAQDKRFTKVSAGYAHTCAISAAGNAFCWGEGADGRLGNNSTTTLKSPDARVQGAAGALLFKEISAGYNHSCGVSDSGVVYCWGDNSKGQLGDESRATSLVGVTHSVSKQFVTVSAGDHSSCAIDAASKLWCWGTDQYHLLGNLTAQTDQIIPLDVSGTSSFRSLPNSGRAQHWCVVRADGVVTCWGIGANGRLGYGVTTDRATPVAINTSGITAEAHRRFLSVAVTSSSSCGVNAAGDLYCWGSAVNGRLGNGDSATDAVNPVSVDKSALQDGEKFIQITGGGHHLCALTSRGVIYCWGNNGGANGALGVGISENIARSTITEPVRTVGITSASRFISVDYGNEHACGVRSDGIGFCWGEQANGRLGNGDDSSGQVKQPVRVKFAPGSGGQRHFRHISAGGAHSCGLTADGTVWCWGSDQYGQLGNGSGFTSDAKNPVRIGPISGDHFYSRVTAGGKFTCAITSFGPVYCWGDDTYGQLGNGSALASDAPIVITGYPSTHLSAGDEHACLVKFSGDAYCWGRNVDGRLGINSSSDKNAPILVSGGAMYAAIEAGRSGTCGLRDDGRVSCWGQSALVPGMVSLSLFNPTLAKKIAVGNEHKCILLSDGRVACWGGNSLGQLGDGSNTDVMMPSVIDSSTIAAPAQFVSIAAGGHSTGGVVADGRAFAWGYNASGQLGDGSLTDMNKPKAMASPLPPPAQPTAP